MTRHDLKEQLQHDQFTDTASQVIHYVQSHRQQVIRWTVIAVGVLVVAGGIWGLLSYQKSQRQKDLANALALMDAQVGPANDYAKTFPTQEAKDAAVTKALQDVATKDNGSNEGMIALYYLSTLKAKKDQAAAEVGFKQVADSSSDVAALAKIALAQIYAGENKVAAAQGLLRSIISKPTDLVSKAQAEILLAQMEATVDPADARAELRSVATEAKERPAVSRAADEVSAKLK